MARMTLFVVVGCIVGGVSVADEIRLKNGKTVSGQVTKYEKGKFTVVVDGSSQDVKNTAVDSIVFGGSPAVLAPGAVAGAGGEVLSVIDCEKGREGFLRVTFTVGSTDEGRFIGTAGRRAAIIQGVDTSSLVTGRFVKLTQRLRCAGTEKLDSGQVVYVFEPVVPTENQVSRAEDPALATPHPGGVNVQDIRGR